MHPATSEFNTLVYLVSVFGSALSGGLIYVIRIARRIDRRDVIRNQEHELLMEWWKDEHPGQKRPAELLRAARRQGA